MSYRGVVVLTGGSVMIDEPSKKCMRCGDFV